MADKKCSICKKPVEARMIQAALVDWGDLSSVVFAKTLPVLLCPRCDTGEEGKHRITGPPPQRRR